MLQNDDNAKNVSKIVKDNSDKEETVVSGRQEKRQVRPECEAHAVCANAHPPA